MRLLSDVSKAFDIKLWFRFRRQHSLWAKSLMIKYCKRAIPGTIVAQHHDSVIWKRMLKVQNITQENSYWRVGSGLCYFWVDKWYSQGQLLNFVVAAVSTKETVDEKGEGRIWVLEKLSENLPRHVVADIFLNYPCDLSCEAQQIWMPSTNGLFSTKTAWNLIRTHYPTSVTLEKCWHERFPVSISIFWWKHNWLPVEEELRIKGIQLASKCQYCNKKESIHHVMLENDEVQRVWNWYAALFQVTIREEDSCLQRFSAWIHSSQLVGKGHIRILLPMLIGWYSWKARNDAKFNKLPIKANVIIKNIQARLCSLHLAKPFNVMMWEGDLQLASSWQIHFIAPRIGRNIPMVWSKPPQGYVKINSDGAFNHRSGRAAAGGLIRDEEGRILEVYQSYLGPSSVIQAELHGIWHGLKICERNN